MSKKFTLIALVAAFAATVIFNGCSPAPRRTLSKEDKTADLYWLYSQFNEYYAPLNYKEQRSGFKYEELKQKYLQEAAGLNPDNDEFYKLMYRFVAEFKDAHTSASMTNSALPARTKVGYLGFSGKRAGDKLVVTDLLPTIKKDPAFPVKVGDFVTKLNGVALKDVVQNEMVVYRNLGQDESNLTYHMNKIFNRVSTANGLPKGDTAVLTLERGGKEQQVALPWIVKDLYVFQREQKEATKQATGSTGGEEAVLGSIFQFGFPRFDGKIENANSLIPKLIRNLPGYEFNWTRTFEFVDNIPTWAAKLMNDPTATAGEKPVTGFEALAAERNVPANALPIADAKTYPTYVTREKVLGSDGKETGATKFVAYMYLNTFSPGAPEEVVLKEVQATLDKLKEFGTTDLVIDMINNGGGSLVLGMKLAQLLSKEKVVQPEIQFRTSETWLDDFEKASLGNGNDADREFAARAFAALKEDAANGKRLSRRLSTELLDPFGFTPNTKLESKLNIVLLVNEMCASMCDIFTATLKDNNMARVVGSKTMGAGGNVVNHPMAPNSHMIVNQTESLIVRKDGSYVENNGVDPDVAVKVSESVMEKYAPVRQKAISLLVTQ